MKNTIILFAAIFFGISACSESEWLDAGDYFYVSHKGASMPVWVMGNPESEIMIITVHGGPGDSGLEHHIADGFKMLEEDYLMVYYDQRFSGMTQGRYDIVTLHPDQFIEDTEKVVEVLLDRYPGKKYFMMGHSWGGQLSAGYLGRDEHDELFNGWIDLDGSIYGFLEFNLMKEWILERVPAKMEEPGADTEFWQIIIDYYDSDPYPGNYSEALPYMYVAALKGDAWDWEAVEERSPIPYKELIFKSMFAMSYYSDAFNDVDYWAPWDSINYTPELRNITIPALMLWGENDGVVPLGVASYVLEHLATSDADKYIVAIPECGHGPQHEHPERFYQEVRDFVETYKNRK